MKAYRKIMRVITKIEDVVLVLAFVLVLALTFGNVVARKVFAHSWGFTEEIVVAVFVLLSLLAAGVAAREGGLVNLALLPDHIGPKGRKVLNGISTLICTIYSVCLAYEGGLRMVTDHTYSPILHIAKSVFWAFVLVGGISLALHFVENCVEMLASGQAPETSEEAVAEEYLEAEEKKPAVEKSAAAKTPAAQSRKKSGKRNSRRKGGRK